jgi:hypothetical protein
MIRNLTPHPLIFRDADGTEARRYQPDGAEARLAEQVRPDTEPDIDGIPVESVAYGAAAGLPDPVPGVALVVPLVTALALRAAGDTRDDLFVPGQQTRNEQGAVNGCRTLRRVR